LLKQCATQGIGSQDQSGITLQKLENVALSALQRL